MSKSQLLDTYRGTVYPWHCDHMNHMNVMWYVGKFDEATWNLMSHLGMNAGFLLIQGLSGIEAASDAVKLRSSVTTVVTLAAPARAFLASSVALFSRGFTAPLSVDQAKVSARSSGLAAVQRIFAVSPT